jgi:hypothetical protein
MSFVPAMISFLQFYGWKRIMFITQQEGFFMGVSTMYGSGMLYILSPRTCNIFCWI